MKLDMQMFTGLNFVLGLVITVFAIKLSHATKTCTDEKVTNSVKGLLVVGVILITSTATSFACGCGRSSAPVGNLGYIASGLNFALGVAIITMASLVHNKCGTTKSDTGILIALGSILLVLALGYLGMKGYKNRGSFGVGSNLMKMMNF